VSESWAEFDAAVGDWRLGDLPVGRLPSAAAEALSAGCDTPSLARLAGMEKLGWSEIEPVVARVLEERGQPLPTHDEAVKWAADGVLRRLIAGHMRPRAAVERLRALAWKADNPQREPNVSGPAREDLSVFVGLSDEWDALAAGERDRQEVRDRTMHEARKVLAQGGVRSASR
jgi:hypothetical protein